ncbi:hypothetical protein ACG98H_11160 [Corynebacterium sp. L4756]|uniref:hypothetical protein n=1 Tax=unclassified Corynebacterium TaxID=2624378 RepID=UPI00374CFC8B
MKNTKPARLLSILFLIALIVMFILRGQGIIADSIAVPGVLVIVIGLIVSTTVFGISTYRNRH